MTKVTVRAEVSSYELASLDLPVEIHDLDLHVVARGTVREQFTLPRGTYIARSPMPGGQILGASFEVVDEEPVDVTLRPAPGEASPEEVQERARFVWGLDPALASEGGKGGAAEAAARHGLRAFEWSEQSGTYFVAKESLSDAWIGAIGSVVRMRMPYHHPLRLLSVEQPGDTRQNIVLPPLERSSGPDVYEIVLASEHDGTVDATAHLTDGNADLMLQYGGRGLLREAASMADEVADDAVANLAERLLYHKLRSPLSAAAGAYVLLRMGRLDQLHDWTENLYNWVEWLPDGAIIRAEHLAREGDHEEAAERLLALKERGLPIFSDGLSYAINLLDQYTVSAAHNVRHRAWELRDRLLPVAAVTDFTKSFTTYLAPDPNDPVARSARATHEPAGYEPKPEHGYA